MNRGTELWLGRGLFALAGLAALAACGLVALTAFEQPDAGAEAVLPACGAERKPQSSAPAHPALEKLAQTNMTRTVAPKAAASQKPVAPPLEALIRVKGIMDYGDPKTNEAIIEDLRSGQAQNYKAGDKLKDLDALVKQVDVAVTLEYDGKTIRMDTRGGERSEHKPVASPSGGTRTAAHEGTLTQP